jgi:hypothetical protein
MEREFQLGCKEGQEIIKENIITKPIKTFLGLIVVEQAKLNLEDSGPTLSQYLIDQYRQLILIKMDVHSMTNLSNSQMVILDSNLLKEAEQKH